MSKSASGTKENPGRNVKAKSGLNKSILVRDGVNSKVSLSISSIGVEGK